MDRMYTQKLGSAMGSSMGNPLGVSTNYSGMQYVAKSRLKDPSTASVRSKSMRSGLSRRSQANGRKPTKRFNEELDTMSRRSKPGHHHARGSVKPYKQNAGGPSIDDKKKQVIEKIEKMDDNIDKLRSTFNIDREKPTYENGHRPYDEFDRADETRGNEEDKQEPLNEEEANQREDQELHDEIDSLYYGSYSESRRSENKSRRSQMTSATYISKLEKELQEERKARERLSKELEEIKKLSSEISSHLGLNKAIGNNN